jgi:IclR family pca regulon transcriptional regulator
LATPHIRSVLRAIRILSAFEASPCVLTIADIAKRLDMNYKTTHRFLLTLEESGALARVGRSEFTLGVLLADLGQRVSLQRVLRRASQPHLSQLSARYGESTQVAVRRYSEAFCVAHVSGKHASSPGIRVGRTVPLHSSAEGKVLVASMDDEKLHSMVKVLQLEPLTPRTLVSRPALARQLLRVRAQGYAMSDEEHFLGVKAIAVPIRNLEGGVIAAMSLSGPASRLTPLTERIRCDLQESAQRVSSALYERGKPLLASRNGSRGTEALGPFRASR